MPMLRNKTRQSVLADKVSITMNFLQRAQGLLGRVSLPGGEALIITRCSSVHMFFMRFPIDVIFCDRQKKVVGICRQLKPNSLSPIFFQAAYAIELPVGTVTQSKTEVGDDLEF